MAPLSGPLNAMESHPIARSNKRKTPDSEVEERSRQIKAALVEAAEAGDLPEIRQLAAFDVRVDVPATLDAWHPEYTPLHWAITNGHVEAVQLLCNLGADVNKPTGDGWTPLDLALGCCRPAIAAYLQRLGAKQSPGKNILEIALDPIRGAKAFASLHQAGVSGEFTFAQLEKLFFMELSNSLAAQKPPCMESLRYLLKLGVPVDTAVPYAMLKGNKHILEVLYILGAHFDLFKPEDHDDTELPEVSRIFIGFIRKIQTLEKKRTASGFSHNTQQELQNLCMQTVYLNFPLVLKKLLSYKEIDVNKQLDDESSTFLIDVNKQINEEGVTFLHEAVALGHVGVVRVLLNHPATNTLLKNEAKLTPAELAWVLFDLSIHKPEGNLTPLDCSHIEVWQEFRGLKSKLLALAWLRKNFEPRIVHLIFNTQ